MNSKGVDPKGFPPSYSREAILRALRHHESIGVVHDVMYQKITDLFHVEVHGSPTGGVILSPREAWILVQGLAAADRRNTMKRCSTVQAAFNVRIPCLLTAGHEGDHLYDDREARTV
jgi:hypothetical protein